MASGPFTIVQLAQAVGMSVEDVRFYRDGSLLQPPRRRRSRTGDMAFYGEHVERLHFIRQALACGLTHDDIAEIVDPNVLGTCGDVYAIASRRLEQMRKDGTGETPAAACLTKISAACLRVGSRTNCAIIKALSTPGH